MTDQKRSPHVLNAASNLMGICFVVLTSLKVLHVAAYTFVDEFTMVLSVLFMTSCLFSYLSIRTRQPRMEIVFERVADVVFIAGLLALFLLMLLLAFNFMH